MKVTQCQVGIWLPRTTTNHIAQIKSHVLTLRSMTNTFIIQNAYYVARMLCVQLQQVKCRIMFAHFWVIDINTDICLQYDFPCNRVIPSKTSIYLLVFEITDSVCCNLKCF